MGEIENPWHSRPIDVHRWSDHPEVAVLVDRIWDDSRHRSRPNLDRNRQDALATQAPIEAINSILFGILAADIIDELLDIEFSILDNPVHQVAN